MTGIEPVTSSDRVSFEFLLNALLPTELHDLPYMIYQKQRLMQVPNPA